MIVTANQIYGTATVCGQAPRGKINDLLFDDRCWTVSNVVVRLGNWFTRRDVLVAPREIESVDWPTHRVYLALSEERLRAAPSLESNPPVALRKYWESQRMIAWEAYWSGLFQQMSDEGDPHLRNTRAVAGHHVFGLDSEAGRVDNFVIDDSTWRIRYLVVRIGKRQEAKRVIVEPRWVDSIDWDLRGVYIHLPKVEIEHCGEFVNTQNLNLAMHK
ncbi:MAG: hypothetical protein GX594_19165 [Pirellulaceae bacterium]|nr:hypothetical protein [Pirellulaceae bacterium]